MATFARSAFESTSSSLGASSTKPGIEVRSTTLVTIVPRLMPPACFNTALASTPLEGRLPEAYLGVYLLPRRRL
jgi:hypothetical protein